MDDRRPAAFSAPLALAALLLAGCQGDDGPTAADVEAAYEARGEAARAELLALHGTPEAVPGARWGFASVRREVALTDCEKAQDERGFLCVYDLRLFAMGGDVEMERFSPVRDVEGRVYRVGDGWAVEEIVEDGDGG